jgi:hypothetical protein
MYQEKSGNPDREPILLKFTYLGIAFYKSLNVEPTILKSGNMG